MKILIALLLFAAVQDKKGQPSKVDQSKVDGAIKRGVEYLKSQLGKYGSLNRRRSEELILWTFTHAGVPENDPDFEKLFKTVTESPLEWTYNVSLQAMILEELDRVKYQGRIAQCAQFLVDNQCKNGQWSYGEPDLFAKDVPTGGAPKAVASGGGKATKPGPGGTRTKPKVVRHVPVKQMKSGPATGDNSNSQYAALGLRACLDAGIDVDPQVLAQARKWWIGAQNSDGGWGYNDHGEKGGGENEESVSNTSYGSMTVGAVGALCIYDYYMGMQYKQDPAVNRGLEWITKNYDVTKNPRKKNFAFLYYLYGLERAGILYGTERFGANEWYPDGANYLLGTQQASGGWTTNDRIGGNPRDTCFAVLFLRRGTMPLRPVATGGGDPNAPPVANGGAPVANGGNKDPGLVGKKALDSFAPGWRLLNNGNGENADKLIEVGGKTGVLTTYPPNLLQAPTFRKTVDVQAVGKTMLRAVVGHHPQGAWTFVIKIDGKEVLTQPVSTESSKEGWVEVTFDLTPNAGKSVQIDLCNQAGGQGVELAYWAEISIKGD